jgi:N-acetyltransferase
VWEELRSLRLEGRLVILEALKPGHQEELFAAASNPEIWSWLPVDAAESKAAFQDWFEQAMAAAAAGRQAAFATVDRRSNVAVGSTRYLELAPEHRRVEIGWTWVAPSRWSSGVNVEAKLLMLRHAFEELGCLRVEFLTDSNNERSRGALGALPAQLEGVLRKHRLVRGRRRDTAVYSIIDDEWPAVRENLERRLRGHLEYALAPGPSQ